MSKIDCPICNEDLTELEDLYDHLDEEHADSIPKNMSPAQYIYFLKTGRDHGNCVMCKSPTKWNETTGKYHRFCDIPSHNCTERYRQLFKDRMIGKYGKVHLLDEPDQQKKMLANRSISGTYKWTDGKTKTYTGSYELDLLKMLDVFMNFESEDIMVPSPHTYYYEHEGQKRFYIPDVFIASLGLEIEVKDGGDNPNMHHKIQDVDKVKEKLKDDVLMSQKDFSYVKIVNKNYEPFFEFLFKMKQQFINMKNGEELKPIFIVKESLAQPQGQIVIEGASSTVGKNFNAVINNRIDMLNVVSSFKDLRKGMITVVNNSTTEEELNYLVMDKNIVKTYLTNLAKIETRLKDACNEHIKWLDNEYTKLLNEKRMFLKKKT